MIALCVCLFACFVVTDTELDIICLESWDTRTLAASGRTLDWPGDRHSAVCTQMWASSENNERCLN